MALCNKFCFILTLLGYVCNILGYISPMWFVWRNDEEELTSQGLWQRCTHRVSNTSYTCCDPITSLYDTTEAKFPEWRQAQLLMGISLLTGLITILLFIKSAPQAFTGAMNVLSACLVGVSVYQYSNGIKTDRDLQDVSNFVSFYASVICMVSFCMAAFINRLQPQVVPITLPNRHAHCQLLRSLQKFEKLNVACVAIGFFLYFWSFLLPIWIEYRYVGVDGQEYVGYKGLFGQCYTNSSSLCCTGSSFQNASFEVSSIRILGFLSFVFAGAVLLLTTLLRAGTLYQLNFLLRLMTAGRGFRNIRYWNISAVSAFSRLLLLLVLCHRDFNLVPRSSAMQCIKGTATFLITSCGFSSYIYSSLLNIIAGLFYLLSLLFLISASKKKKHQTGGTDEETQIPVDDQCCVCFDKRINTKFEKCGHSVCCTKCSRRIMTDNGKCPICRETIDKILTRY